MLKENILIVGGYGEVGGKIAKLLLRKYPNRVWIAGRDIEKAKQFCAQQNNLATPIQLDVTNTINGQQLANVALVIMCLEQENTQFAELCLHEGIQYIDISASYSFLQKLELLNPIAVKYNTTAILSVGLAPGLTNLMAMHVAQQFSSLEKLHISILLGAGDSHGTAAIHWILNQLNNSYTIAYQKDTQKVTNFTNKRVVNFVNIGNRSLYQFNFSDQHTLSKHFPTSPIITRMGFDVEWLNLLVSFLQKSRLSIFLKWKWLKNIVASLMQKLKIGSPICVIKIEATGIKQHKKMAASLTFAENDESFITAKIAATVAQKLLEKEYSSGTLHIEELFTLEALKEQFVIPTVQTEQHINNF
ncbi:saccharopine dehydrogenase NADP-binding domain-containing protein [Lysinibacillus sp. NPDC048646]|uniref:saccharopine dehydrogenase family protein n=1 Tax=Lysinibacillus sp. NPDC048646 TaxID=3390574 RepID=UPI003D07649F